MFLCFRLLNLKRGLPSLLCRETETPDENQPPQHRQDAPKGMGRKSVRRRTGGLRIFRGVAK